MFPNSIQTLLKRLLGQWRTWWRGQAPHRQDRFAFVAPVIAVVLFLTAIASSFWYLRYEELDREQEVVQRDVEYAQQRLRVRLLDKQEQLMRMARDLASGETQPHEFQVEAQTQIEQTPELSGLIWLDPRQRIRSSYASMTGGSLADSFGRVPTPSDEMQSAFELARDLLQPVYSQPITEERTNNESYTTLQLQLPIINHSKFEGVLVAEYSMEGLLRHAVPEEISNRYALTLRDAQNRVLAGQISKARPRVNEVLPWLRQTNVYEVPITPVGYALSLHAQTYRTSKSLVGNALFWFVAVLSAMTTWMLIGTWRHTRRRVQAQQALVAETNFRRAMENSILTGMRAMDMKGRITYVNAAFCQMTGWSEEDLVGRVPPFPYWPDDDREQLIEKFQQELKGETTAAGFQVRVKRKNGEIFDARLYVSPLVDARGEQTGWMTSMTDITEPNRVREQLSASHDRFTTVLEALDASVSVAPLGSKELLFANKLYRQWFDHSTTGHLSMVSQAGQPAASNASEASQDDVNDQNDAFVGLPTNELEEAKAEHAEIYVPELDKWLEVRSRYLNWVDGRLAQMVIASDITARRQAEEQAQIQAERAQTASRLITMGEMASSVAHELNQPLTAINNYCSGMVSRIQANNLNQDDLLKALEKTAHQAQRAGQIIQRIRSFVKRSEPNRTPSDVNAMVAEAVELAGFEMRRRQVRLSQFVAAKLPLLNVDPILIEQVLVNLLRNAAESIDNAQRPSTQRDVQLRVEALSEENTPGVMFSVIDTGHGFPPEVVERLFEAFFSTKSEGMGMGLNLCRSIVESHKGRLKAENLYNAEEVTGCRFSFWIPVR